MVVGVPVNGVCGREAGWLAVGGAEGSDRPSGDAEAKGIMPKTPNQSAEFQFVISRHRLEFDFGNLEYSISSAG